MAELYHSPLFEKIRNYFQKSNPDDTIFLYVPYIKKNVLEELLKDISNEVVIVTTWEPRDIQFGSSDLELYAYCHNRRATLYVHPKIHLKVYSVGLESAILATGNVSHKGLLSNGNYEVGTNLEHLSNDDRLFFAKIRNEARLVDDAMYDTLKKWHEDNRVGRAAQARRYHSGTKKGRLFGSGSAYDLFCR